jgi:isopenicillin N synthase-like dioxygenase
MLFYKKGDDFLYPNYLYRVNPWTQILILLQRSLYAEEMVCAMSSQLFHIPKTKDLKGNSEMHNHLVPASYHRVTAVGSAQRLSNGEQQQSIVETMTTCIINAENQDKKVREGLKIMEENATPDFKPFIKLIIQWQNQAESYLSQTKAVLKSMGISFPTESEQQSGEYDAY